MQDRKSGTTESALLFLKIYRGTIVWGGVDNNNNNYPVNTGGRYNPGTNTWTATSTTNAPTARQRPPDNPVQPRRWS
ncbi:MAG: hypothetical protein WA269_13955 [Candidatus Udaeobacter sp.]